MFIFSSLNVTVKNTFNYKGRSDRFEVSLFQIFYLILIICLNVFLNYLLKTLLFEDIFLFIATFCFLNFLISLPSLSLSIRRYHDIGKSGWFSLWSLTILAIPYIWYLQFIKKSESYDNKYGPYIEPIHKGNLIGFTSILFTLIFTSIVFLNIYDTFIKVLDWSYVLVPKTNNDAQIELAERIISDVSGKHIINLRVVCSEGDSGIFVSSQSKPFQNQPAKEESFDIVNNQIQLKVTTEKFLSQFSETEKLENNKHLLHFTKGFNIDLLTSSEITVKAMIKKNPITFIFNLKDDNVIKTLKSCVQ